MERVPDFWLNRAMPTIRTGRLTLRPWQDSDLEPFAALNADPRVMEFMLAPLSAEQSNAFATRIRTHFTQRGYGLWAVETRDAPFIGFIGLQWANFEASFTPALEIGFRLAAEHWGQGYATEGGVAALAWLFANTDEAAVHSWTAVINQRSRRVIAKLGLQRVAAFEHPRVPEGHALRPHVLFRMSREDWAGKVGSADA